MSKLRYELTTDKSLLMLTDSGEDVQLWNKALDELNDKIGKENMTWFKAPWLMTECYMYRRLREAMLLCICDVKFYDPFEEAKKETFNLSETTILGLITSFCPIGFENEEKDKLVKMDRLKLLLHVIINEIILNFF